MTETVVRLQLDDPRWHAFVASQSGATALHLPAWASFLADCYGFTSFVLAAEDDRGIVAGLPVLEVRRPFGKVRWVSLPFTDECPPLGEPPAWLSVALDAARRGAGISSLEVRGLLADGASWSQGYSHRLTLQPNIDALGRGYRSSVRQGIRVAAREGVSVRVGETPADLTKTFYSLHLSTRRRLGVPVQRRRYFRLLWQRLIAPGHGFVLIAERENVPLAAAVFLQSNGTVLYKYGASDAQHWGLRANNALFQAAIERAAVQGEQIFDWGRTDFADEGLRRFKAGWGSDEHALTYTTFGGEAAGVSGAGRELARGVIRRSPSPVCRIAGAVLYRYAA